MNRAARALRWLLIRSGIGRTVLLFEFIAGYETGLEAGEEGTP